MLSLFDIKSVDWIRSGMRFVLPLIISLTTLVLASGCSPGGPGHHVVSEDLELQARYETAVRALDEIKRLQKRGDNVFADCKTINMLFVKELKRSKAAAARKLAKDIIKTCQTAAPRKIF